MRQQLFKGNEYWFWLGTEVEAAKVSVHVYDSDGKLVDSCIECPYHASRFDLEDGHVVNGPAVHSQPCLDIRAHNGQIEVRKASLPIPWTSAIEHQ